MINYYMDLLEMGLEYAEQLLKEHLPQEDKLSRKQRIASFLAASPEHMEKLSVAFGPEAVQSYMSSMEEDMRKENATRA